MEPNPQPWSRLSEKQCIKQKRKTETPSLPGTSTGPCGPLPAWAQGPSGPFTEMGHSSAQPSSPPGSSALLPLAGPRALSAGAAAAAFGARAKRVAALQGTLSLLS
jgi:hypothetical protein